MYGGVGLALGISLTFLGLFYSGYGRMYFSSRTDDNVKTGLLTLGGFSTHV
jgi:hypothetical protein